MADTDETDNYLFILINKSMILKVYNILCNSIKNKTLKIKIVILNATGYLRHYKIIIYSMIKRKFILKCAFKSAMELLVFKINFKH